MTGIDSQLILRRFTLFVGILLSGGLLIFPRLPLLAVVGILCLILRPNSLGFRREMAPVAVFFAAVVILSGINDGFALEPLAIRFANFGGGLLLLGLYGGLPRDTLPNDLDFILKWMSYQTIATFVLANGASGLFVPIEINETTYQTVLLIFNYHTMLESQSLLNRPDGFFFEPGVLQIYMNIFLFLSLFITRSRIRIVLAVLAVIMTQSTTGYIIMSILLAAAFLQYLRRNNASQFALTLTLGAMLAVPFVLLIGENFASKTTGILAGSSWAREYDFRTGVAVAAEHPVTGIGFDYDRYYEEARRLGYMGTRLSAETIAERANSNGVVWLAVTLGFPMMIAFMICLWRQICFPERWLFFMILVVGNFGEALLLTPFFLIFAFSGMLTQVRLMKAANPVRLAYR